MREDQEVKTSKVELATRYVVLSKQIAKSNRLFDLSPDDDLAVPMSLTGLVYSSLDQIKNFNPERDVICVIQVRQSDILTVDVTTTNEELVGERPVMVMYVVNNPEKENEKQTHPVYYDRFVVKPESEIKYLLKDICAGKQPSWEYTGPVYENKEWAKDAACNVQYHTGNKTWVIHIRCEDTDIENMHHINGHFVLCINAFAADANPKTCIRYVSIPAHSDFVDIAHANLPMTMTTISRVFRTEKEAEAGLDRELQLKETTRCIIAKIECLESDITYLQGGVAFINMRPVKVLEIMGKKPMEKETCVAPEIAAVGRVTNTTMCILSWILDGSPLMEIQNLGANDIDAINRIAEAPLFYLPPVAFCAYFGVPSDTWIRERVRIITDWHVAATSTFARLTDTPDPVKARAKWAAEFAALPLDLQDKFFGVFTHRRKFDGSKLGITRIGEACSVEKQIRQFINWITNEDKRAADKESVTIPKWLFSELVELHCAAIKNGEQVDPKWAPTVDKELAAVAAIINHVREQEIDKQ